ncbi:MAG: PTS fructose transporter subunit IIA [Pseudomonadota bacterium]
MIGIVIVAHGRLATELKNATEHVVGPQDCMIAIQISADENRSRAQAAICEAADAVDRGHGVVLVTDMYGGSPSNLSLNACKPQNRKIVTGVNLPMLIKLAKSRALSVDEAVKHCVAAGKRYINAFDGATE